MSSITTTIIIYKGTKLSDRKNFVVDSFSTYLSDKVLETISNFQFQSPLVELEIKIEKSQVGVLLDKENFQLADYLSVTPSNTGARTYYYFIKKKRWRADSTILLELKMDILNTFKWNVDYVPTNKTIVEREHKNRFALSNKNPILYPSVTERFFGTLIRQLIMHLGMYDYKFELLIPIANIPSFDKEHFRVDCEIMTTQYARDEWDYSFEIPAGDPNNIHLTIHFYSVVDNGVDWDFSYRYSVRNTDGMKVRKIDLYSEGITPILYKKSETILRDTLDTSWNLGYKSGANDSDPVVCELFPNKELQLRHPTSMSRIQASSLANGTWYLLYVAPDGLSEGIAHSFPLRQPTSYGLVNVEISGRTYHLNASYRTEGTSVIWTFDVLRLVRNNSNGMDVYLETWKYVMVYGIGENWAYPVESELLDRVTFDVSDIYWDTPINLSYKTGTESETAYDYKFYEYLAGSYFTYNGGYSDSTFIGIRSYDRTQQQLYKIINIPYCPSNYSYNPDTNLFEINPIWDYDSGKKLLELNDLNAPFFRTVNVNIENPVFHALIPTLTTPNLRDDNYESKLFNSDFYQIKFVYDSFAFTYQLEKIDVDWWASVVTPAYTFNFIMTTTINSKFLFEFPDYLLKYSTEDYDRFLPVARNNEIPIYNNEYLNYLRTAYRYDLKAKDRTINTAKLGLGLGVAGSMLGGALGIASGNPAVAVSSIAGASTSVVGSIVSTINTIQKTEEDFALKQELLKAQSISVSGSDDFDLMEYYAQNRAKLCIYEPSPQMKKALADLFYYCGYATNEQKVPTLTTRTRFNFVKCQLYLESECYNEEITESLISKFAEGVTFIHYYNSGWDIAQIYENTEVSL